MSDKDKLRLLALVVFGVFIVAAEYIYNNDVAILNPAGLIGGKERGLIITATLLMLIVVVPVYILTFSIAWRYREGNKRAKYTPEQSGNRKLETLWWAVPGAIIAVLSVITWTSAHELDPFKPVQATNEPIDIQVVALDWKWLFIYPKQNVASVNFVEMPMDTPVNFRITSDAPMNSFWIPKLGGQIYAMSGMTTQLHLVADKPGDYSGGSANISGRGFAGMTFTARVADQTSYNQWVQTAKSAPKSLTRAEYDKLAQPSVNNPKTYYSSVDKGLFDSVVAKFLRPAAADLPTEASRGGAY